MKKILAAGTVLFCVITTSCSNDNKDDLVQTAPTKESIHTDISVQHHNDSLDVLTTKYKIYDGKGRVIEHTKYDTIPALGMDTVADENDTKGRVKKDYDIYITVK
jgi:hypothetical protein